MTDFLWNNVFRRTKDQRDLIKTLKNNFLFQDLSPLELRFVEKIVNIRHYRPGEIIFRQGEIGVGMYIINRGTVNIYVEEIVPQTGEAKTSHITQLKAGEFFGDLALVEDNGLRSASAIAHEECVLIGFFKPDMLEIANRNPSAGVKVLLRLGEVLGTRLRQTTARISELAKEKREEKMENANL